MIQLTLTLGFGVLIVAVLVALYRLAKGPSVIDRILAFDIVATCAVGMVILLSLAWHSPFYLELVLAFSLLGFFTAVAFVYHLNKTYEIHREGDEGPEGKLDFTGKEKRK